MGCRLLGDTHGIEETLVVAGARRNLRAEAPQAGGGPEEPVWLQVHIVLLTPDAGLIPQLLNQCRVFGVARTLVEYLVGETTDSSSFADAMAKVSDDHFRIRFGLDSEENQDIRFRFQTLCIAERQDLRLRGEGGGAERVIQLLPREPFVINAVGRKDGPEFVFLEPCQIVPVFFLPAGEVVTDDVEEVLSLLLHLLGGFTLGQFIQRSKEMLRARCVTDAKIEQKRIRSPRPWSPFFVEPPLRPEPDQLLEFLGVLVGAIRDSPSSVPDRNHLKLAERALDVWGSKQDRRVIGERNQQLFEFLDRWRTREEDRHRRFNVDLDRLPHYAQVLLQELLGHRVIALLRKERSDADGILEVTRQKRALCSHISNSRAKDRQHGKSGKGLRARFAGPADHQIPEQSVESAKLRWLCVSKKSRRTARPTGIFKFGDHELWLKLIGERKGMGVLLKAWVRQGQGRKPLREPLQARALGPPPSLLEPCQSVIVSQK